MKNTLICKGYTLSNFRKSIGLLLLFLFGLSLQSNAQDFTIKNWWNVKTSAVESVDACNRAFKVTIVKGEKSSSETKLEIRNNGEAMKNTEFKISDSKINTQDATGFVFNISGESFDFYIDLTQVPYLLSLTAPSVDIYTCGVKKDVEQPYELGTNVDYSVSFCSKASVDPSSLNLSYQWQNSKDGADWSDIDGATDETLSYKAVFDYRYIRCAISFNDPSDSNNKKTIYSNADKISIIEPDFDVVFSPNVENLNSFEHEVGRWESFDILVQNVTAPDYNIYIEERDPDDSATFGESSAVVKGNEGWTVVSEKNKEYKVTVEIELLHYNGTKVAQKFSKVVLVRSIYTADADSLSTVLFYDDFGYMGTADKVFYYKDEDGNDQEGTVYEPIEGVYWAEDLNGFVTDHTYAKSDPLSGAFDSDDCASDNYKHYSCWNEGACNGYRVEDGYYAIITDPSKSDCGNNDYWYGTDHTGNSTATTQGAMLFVNCKEDSKNTVIYERTFKLPDDCNSNAYVLFSAFVSNAAKRLKDNEGKDLNPVPVNVRFDILNEDGQLVGSCSSGDVLVRSYANPNWAHMTTAFKLSSSTGKYKVQITNNQDGGAGNDVLLDDISVTLCYPNIELETDAKDGEILNDTVYVCGKDRELTIVAENKNDITNYIPNPLYCFQYTQDHKTWHTIAPETPSAEDPNYTTEKSIKIELSRDKNSFVGVTDFRVIAANSKSTIDAIIAEPNPSNYPSLGCTTIFAVDSSLTVIFRPMGKNIFNERGCIGDVLTITGDNTRPNAVWLDAHKQPLAISDSVLSINNNVIEFKIPESIVNANSMTDTLFYMGTEVTACTDTQIIVIEKYKDVEFNCVSEPTYCEFGKILTPVAVEPATGITYKFHIDGTADAEDQTGESFTIKQLNPEQFDYKVSVVGNASERCPATGEYNFSVYKKFDLTLKANNQNDTTKVCLSSDGAASDIKLTASKVFQGATPSYDSELTTTYYWYRVAEDGTTKLLGNTTEPTYTDKVSENAIYKYFVTASENVCFTPEDATDIKVNKSNDPTANIRKKLEFDFVQNKTDLCIGEDITLDFKVVNALTADTRVLWREDGEIVKTSLVTPDSYTYIPANNTKFKLGHTMEVSVADQICGGDIKKSLDYTVFQPLKIKLLSDAVDYSDRKQKCISNDNEDNFVNAWVEVEAGNPVRYIWSDGEYAGLVAKRQFIVKPGSNKLNVVAQDDVCNKSGDDTSKDGIEVIAQKPISVSLSADRKQYCEGESAELTLKVENSLASNLESIWSEDNTKVYTNNGVDVIQNHVVANSGTSKVSKTMEAKVLDEICLSPADYVKATVSYDIFKKIKFNLTSDAANNEICMVPDQVNKVKLTATTTQGNPTKWIWSDGKNENETVRDFEVKVGKNTIDVKAYDDVCSKIGGPDGFEAEIEDIDIQAREPIVVTLGLANGRKVMCAGDEVSLKVTVNNSMPNAKTQLTWSEQHGQGDGLYLNGSYVTSSWAPEVGDTKITVSAVDAEKAICPAESASYTVSAQTSTTIKLDADNYAICQDLAEEDTKQYITLTATVLTGKPTTIILTEESGDTIVKAVENGKAEFEVLPTMNHIYSAYGSDEICKTSFSAKSQEVSVTHRFDLTLMAKEQEVQMGDSVRLRAYTTLPYDGLYHWVMVDPDDKDYGKSESHKFNKRLKEDGEYTYRVSVNNGNCGSVKSNKVTVYVADYNIVPNVITPYNGNPKNDTFMKGYEVSIFDRYQQVVFEGPDGWDGTYRGQTATPGTYFYIVKKKDGRVLKGTVEVYK